MNQHKLPKTELEVGMTMMDEALQLLANLAMDLEIEFGKDEYSQRIAPILAKHVAKHAEQLRKKGDHG